MDALGLEKWQVYLFVLAVSQLVGAAGDLVGSRCTRVIYGGSSTHMLIGSSLVGAVIVVAALCAISVAAVTQSSGEPLVRIWYLATNPALIVQNGLLATAYHVAEVELYKSPWGSVIKPVASLFSPLVVIPFSWALLPASSTGEGSQFGDWPIAAVLGVVGSLMVTGKFSKSYHTESSSGAMVGVAFCIIMCCYALWNLLQRVSSERYAVNEYEWIVLDKVVGAMWIMAFFVLIDHSPRLQRRLHTSKAAYVPFSLSFRAAMRETLQRSGISWVFLFSMMQYARMGLTYIFLASDDVEIAVASFMVSISRVFAAGALMVVVNALFPSFLNLSREEQQASLSRRVLGFKSAGLLLTFCSICIWLSAVSAQTDSKTSLASSADAFEILLISDWGCNPRSLKSCSSQGAQRSVAHAMSHYYQRSSKDGPGSYSFILNMGDSFYDDGLRTSKDVENTVTSHEDVYSLPGLMVPWKTVLGNHDYRGDLSFTVGKQLGVIDIPSTYYDWYQQLSADENIHFIALDTNFIQSAQLCKKDARGVEQTPEIFVACRAAFRNGWKEQLQWLEAVLRHDTARWTIVYGHHPCYGAGKWAFHENDPDTTLADQLGGLLERFNVHMYISGHDHVLQAMERRGVQHIIVGAGGADGDSEPLATEDRLRSAGVSLLHTNDISHRYGFGALSATFDKLCIELVSVMEDNPTDQRCFRACSYHQSKKPTIEPCEKKVK
eukprot:SAG31_NODE_4345_length_3329_cov_3.417957_2_plen_721_part_00